MDACIIECDTRSSDIHIIFPRYSRRMNSNWESLLAVFVPTPCPMLSPSIQTSPLGLFVVHEESPVYRTITEIQCRVLWDRIISVASSFSVTRVAASVSALAMVTWEETLCRGVCLVLVKRWRSQLPQSDFGRVFFGVVDVLAVVPVACCDVLPLDGDCAGPCRATA